MRKMMQKIFSSLLSFFIFLPGALAVAESWNPIKAGSISELVLLIVDTAILLAMPIVILAIIYSGFKFLLARGNENKLKEAKNNFIWVIAGTAVLLGAKILTSILQNTTNEILK